MQLSLYQLTIFSTLCMISVQGTYKFSRMRPWSLGGKSTHNPITYLAEDLREPGTFLTFYNTPTASAVMNHSKRKTQLIAGSETERIQTWNDPSLNQLADVSTARFFYLSNGAQINSSHILLPEMYAYCVRILDRDNGIVAPFIGKCGHRGNLVNEPSKPQLASKYSIRYPYSVTVSPLTNKIYLISYSLGSLLELDVNTMYIQTIGVRFAPQYTNDPTSLLNLYSILLTSDGSFGYVRTSRGIIEMDLNKRTSYEHLNTTLTVQNAPVGRVSDLKWLKQDKVLISSEGEINSVRVMDLTTRESEIYCQLNEDKLKLRRLEDFSADSCLYNQFDLMVVSNHTLYTSKVISEIKTNPVSAGQDFLKLRFQ